MKWLISGNHWCQVDVSIWRLFPSGGGHLSTKTHLVLHIGQAHTVIDRKDDDNNVRVMIAERTEPIKIWYPIFS
jgi:hypothetical protein